ncbi:MAG: DUF4430 domain-containing protein [Patescibacteria group bacterium]
MSTKNKAFVILVVIIVAVILIVSWPVKNQNKSTTTVPSATSTATASIKSLSISLSIDGTSTPTSNLEITESSTVFQLLELVNAQNPSLGLQSKMYDKMGVLVEKIGNKANGQDKKYWQYFVNGVQPMVSADKYILKNNDKVEWLFQESSF